MSHLDTFIAALLGLALLFAVVHTFARLSRPLVHKTGLAVTGIAYCVMLGLAMLHPDPIVRVHNWYVGMVGQLTGRHIPYASPTMAPEWWGATALLLLAVAIGTEVLRKRSQISVTLGFVLMVAVVSGAIATWAMLNRIAMTDRWLAVSPENYAIVSAYFVGAALVVLVLVQLGHFVGPILAVLGLGAGVSTFVDTGSFSFAPSASWIDFGTVFDILSWAGVDNLTWQISILFGAVVWGVHDILLRLFGPFSD